MEQKIVQPFGQLTREITVKADEKGLVVVEAWEYIPAVAKGFRPVIRKVPMDSRFMVLALQKVVMDYCNVLFGQIAGPVQSEIKNQLEQKSSEPQESNHDKTDS